MIFVGIDPGQDGAVATLNEDGDVLETEVMKDSLWFIRYIRSLLERDKKMMIFLEKAQVMGNRSGNRSVFTYGVHFGELCGILSCLQIPFEMVPPVTWTKMMHAGVAISPLPKVKSLAAVKRLFPGEILRNRDKPRSVKDHDGIVDALLIAEYGRRKWKGHNV